MRSRSRAFTLAEVVVTIIVIGIVLAIAMPGWKILNSKISASSAADTLLVVQTEARRVAALPGNHYEFPSDLVDQMRSTSWTFTTGASDASNTVSVHRQASNRAVFAVEASEGTCVVLADSPDAPQPRWAQIAEGGSCTASSYAYETITGTREAPTPL